MLTLLIANEPGRLRIEVILCLVEGLIAWFVMLIAGTNRVGLIVPSISLRRL